MTKSTSCAKLYMTGLRIVQRLHRLKYVIVNNILPSKAHEAADTISNDVFAMVPMSTASISTTQQESVAPNATRVSPGTASGKCPEGLLSDYWACILCSTPFFFFTPHGTSENIPETNTLHRS